MDFIEIDNIELNFNEKAILKSIYLKAKKGNITGVLGRNGSGKSTLLRIIFGELIPKNKLIRIDKKPIRERFFLTDTIKYLPQFNIMPNDFTLKKAFYFFDILIKDFIIDFPLFKSYENNKFSNFSGGERRLIETYIILKSPSKIVLLDEPFSHIAPIYIEKLKELISFEKEKKIIIITDHLYKEILSVSDKIYLLKDTWIKEIKNNEDLIFYNYINSL